MYVYLVIMLVTLQCVFTKTLNYQRYDWQPTSNYRGHRSVQQTVYFSNLPIVNQFSQNPLMTNTQITVQTGFLGTSPINFHTVPANWNSGQNSRPLVQLKWPESFFNNNRGFQQIQMPTNRHNQFTYQNIMPGHVVVENLNGKLDDFIKPDLTEARPSISFAPSVQPQYIQGGSVVHGHPTPSPWRPAATETASHKVPVTSRPNNNNVPQITTTSPPVPVPPTTLATAGEQQEKDISNGDEQYDIDVRSGFK